jgi:hypothetical protein
MFVSHALGSQWIKGIFVSDNSQLLLILNNILHYWWFMDNGDNGVGAHFFCIKGIIIAR